MNNHSIEVERKGEDCLKKRRSGLAAFFICSYDTNFRENWTPFSQGRLSVEENATEMKTSSCKKMFGSNEAKKNAEESATLV